MVYVTMFDKFMSGWGRAKGLKSVYVLECESEEEAEVVAENARRRMEMIRINIRYTKPYYTPSKYWVTLRTKNEASAWYKKGAFL